MDKKYFDIDTIEEIKEKAKHQGCVDGFDFSVLMQSLLVSKNAWIMQTGNYENANAICVERLIANIEKHPLLWKKFFMVA